MADFEGLNLELPDFSEFMTGIQTIGAINDALGEESAFRTTMEADLALLDFALEDSLVQDVRVPETQPVVKSGKSEIGRTSSSSLTPSLSVGPAKSGPMPPVSPPPAQLSARRQKQDAGVASEDMMMKSFQDRKADIVKAKCGTCAMEFDGALRQKGQACSQCQSTAHCASCLKTITLKTLGEDTPRRFCKNCIGQLRLRLAAAQKAAGPAPPTAGRGRGTGRRDSAPGRGRGAPPPAAAPPPVVAPAPTVAAVDLKSSAASAGIEAAARRKAVIGMDADEIAAAEAAKAEAVRAAAAAKAEAERAAAAAAAAEKARQEAEKARQEAEAKQAMARLQQENVRQAEEIERLRQELQTTAAAAAQKADPAKLIEKEVERWFGEPISAVIAKTGPRSRSASVAKLSDRSSDRSSAAAANLGGSASARAAPEPRPVTPPPPPRAPSPPVEPPEPDPPAPPPVDEQPSAADFLARAFQDRRQSSAGRVEEAPSPAPSSPVPGGGRGRAARGEGRGGDGGRGRGGRGRG